MSRLHIKYWARMIPYHNWIFAGYYLFFGLMGVNALVFPPLSIDGAAGPFVTAAWGVASLACAIIGIHGALRPNFRSEITACWSGIVAIFAYASTVQLIILVQNQPSRAAQFWVISSHAWMFVLRLVFIRVRAKAALAERIADLKDLEK
jgi:hypothetical protein